MEFEGTHWKTLWDEYAEKERRNYGSMPVEELLKRVKHGYYGNYYCIWYSIAGKATLEQAGEILLEVLHRNIRNLLRYHCASALLKLMDEEDIQPADISGDQPDHDDLLEVVSNKLETLLEENRKHKKEFIEDDNSSEDCPEGGNVTES